jgi:acyl-coenzyme A thioesterase PaaI-like protein
VKHRTYSEDREASRYPSRRDVPLCQQCLGRGSCRVGVDDLRVQDDGGVHGELVVPDDAVGLHVAHGGWTAWVFDEFLGYAATALGGWAVTSSLTIDYRRPVPIGTRVAVTAGGVAVGNRRLRMHGEMRAMGSGALLATADGIWVELADAEGHYERATRSGSARGAGR